MEVVMKKDEAYWNKVLRVAAKIEMMFTTEEANEMTADELDEFLKDAKEIVTS